MGDKMLNSCHATTLTNLKATDRSVFFALYQASYEFKTVKIGQETLATFANVLRQAGHKSVHRLKQKGLLKIERPKQHRYSSLKYKLPDEILTPHAQHVLQPHFAKYGLTRNHWLYFFNQRKLSRIPKKLQTEKRTANSYLRNNKVILVSGVYDFRSKSNSMIVRGDRVVYDKSKILDQLRTSTLSDDPVSPSVRGITSLKLTFPGKIDLLCYPDAAITHADKQIRRMSGVRNAHTLFCKIAENYCKDNGLTPDRSFVKEISYLLKIRPDQPRVESNEVQPLPLTPFADKTQSWNSESKGDSKTISLDEANRRNKQLRVMHLGSKEAEENYSKSYEENRPHCERDLIDHEPQTETKHTCWTEPIQNIIANLSILRKMAQEGNSMQRDIARSAIKTLEPVLAARISGSSPPQSTF